MQFSDSFIRANENPLALPWIQHPFFIEPARKFQLLTNAIHLLDTTQDGLYYQETPLTPTHFAQAVLPIVSNSGVGTGFGVAVRVSLDGKTLIRTVVSTTGIEVRRYIAGVGVTLGTTSTAWADGDTVRVEAIKSTIRVFRNSTIDLTVTEDTLFTGNYVGPVYSSTAGNTPTLNTFSAGDLASYGWVCERNILRPRIFAPGIAR